MTLMAASATHAALMNGHTGLATTLTEALTTVEPGSVVVLSELHDNVSHHANQLAALEELARPGHRVTVGLEFFEFPDQPRVDAFTAGRITEEAFLLAIGWSQGNPFEFYRPLALFPRGHGGVTLALNAPRALARRVSRSGLEALTDEELALLPPGFTLGNDLYRARFAEIMGGHASPESIERYFAAQSLWDDTMAFVASEHVKNNPDEVVAIIVGDFHAAYGGGLPDRLRARGAAVTVISQVVDEDAMPHPLWGARADYVWVTP